jgi:hypothetical protein
MIERVVLTPRADGRWLDATLFGQLAALLSVCAEIAADKKPSAAGPSDGQLSVVTGARNCLDLLLVGENSGRRIYNSFRPTTASSFNL